jgi:hypothetical protein
MGWMALVVPEVVPLPWPRDNDSQTITDDGMP